MSEYFDTNEELIIVQAKIWGPEKVFFVRLALDTGATITTINIKSLLTAGYDPVSSSQRLEMTTGSGIEYVSCLEIQKIDALGQSRENFPVIAHTLPPSAAVDGLLGLDFFKDRELAINFQRGTIDLRQTSI